MKELKETKRKKDRLSRVEKEVKSLHARSEDECMHTWFYDNHVAVVAKYAGEIANNARADAEIAVLAALLHDIARVKKVFDEPAVTEESFRMADDILQRNGYSKKEIELVKKAIVNHGCHDKLPETEEGRAMATADALAHLMTDFYLVFAFNHHWADLPRDFEGYREWVLAKIERDFHKKIFYAKYKWLAEKRYQALKLIFSKTDGRGG